MKFTKHFMTQNLVAVPIEVTRGPQSTGGSYCLAELVTVLVLPPRSSADKINRYGQY